MQRDRATRGSPVSGWRVLASTRVLLRRLGALAAAGAALGCGGAGPPDDGAACLDDVPPVIRLPAGLASADVARQGVLAVSERVSVGEDGVVARHSASFFDTTTYEGDPAPKEAEGLGCWRVTGRAVVRTPPAALSIDELSISGIEGGGVTETDVSGAVSGELAEAPFGEAEVVWSIGSGSAAGASFPSTSVSAPVPDVVRGLAAEASPDGSLELRWRAGGGDFVELDLVTEDPEHPGDADRWNHLVCQVADDGCHRLPSPAVLWLLIHDAEATLTVERHQVGFSAPADDALARGETIRAVETSVDLVLGRVADGTP